MIALFLSLFSVLSKSERSFKIVGNEFQMDGQPFRYVSGSFHYFRQQPEYWEENIKKMASGGLNAVQTYVAWNLHEPTKGNYNFKGIADIEKFIEICQKYNMYVILRPGPYICAEWDFGGLPPWLLAENITLFRSSDEVYLRHVDDWFKVLFGRLKKYMYHNGGNIIMVQVENEYGAYIACDQVYLKHLCDLTHELLGEQTLLFTTDQAYDFMVKCGAIPSEAYATVDFGTGNDPKPIFEQQRRWNGNGPFVNSEYYPGWLDHWQEAHHTVNASDVANYLDQMLALGASVNFYMYYGGTNFFYYNGANGDRLGYQADPTSYDYDAPLSEAGDMTYKYEEIKKVIAKYFSDIPSYEVRNTTKKSFGKVTFTQGVSLYDTLDTVTTKVVESETPKTFEEMGADFGFVMYSTTTKGGTLITNHAHDRSSIYVNRNHVATYFRPNDRPTQIDAGPLDILIENCGRLNYGIDFVDRKGLTTGAKLDYIKDIKNWTARIIPLMNTEGIKFGDTLPTKTSAFYRATFEVDEPADTFFNPTGLSKGIVFINGYNIGRYWTVGPQLTLYVPAPLLVKGTNELIVFEIDPLESVPSISFDDTPQLDTYH